MNKETKKNYLKIKFEKEKNFVKKSRNQAFHKLFIRKNGESTKEVSNN